MVENASWADDAPQYKKDGELHARVEYDHNGEPQLIRLSQDQTRRGEFVMRGSVAVYVPHDVLGLRQAGEDEEEYVNNLPFVQAVDMGGVNDD